MVHGLISMDNLSAALSSCCKPHQACSSNGTLQNCPASTTPKWLRVCFIELQTYRWATELWVNVKADHTRKKLTSGWEFFNPTPCPWEQNKIKHPGRSVFAQLSCLSKQSVYFPSFTYLSWPLSFLDIWHIISSFGFFSTFACFSPSSPTPTPTPTRRSLFFKLLWLLRQPFQEITHRTLIPCCWGVWLCHLVYISLSGFLISKAHLRSLEKHLDYSLGSQVFCSGKHRSRTVNDPLITWSSQSFYSGVAPKRVRSFLPVKASSQFYQLFPPD